MTMRKIEPAAPRKLYAVITKQGPRFVALCPQLNLVTTSEESADDAFEDLVTLCAEHIGFAFESGYSWNDICETLPPAIDELLANAQPNSTRTVTVTIDNSDSEPDRDVEVDRVEIGQMSAAHL